MMNMTFTDFKKDCSCNGANKDKEICFANYTNKDCLSWFSFSLKCLKQDCPIYKSGKEKSNEE